MAPYLVTVIYSYLLGSIPTAYIIARVFYQQDITDKGSRNVGTLNFLRLTRSKSISVIVLLVDTFKGYLAVWFTDSYGYSDLLLLSGVAVVLGHIYSIWLGGRGGRGLATLSGIILYLYPALVGLWWIIFIIIYLLVKKYIIAGMAALVIVNMITALVHSETFLILSVNSVLVMLKYVYRIRLELNNTKKEGG
jgi:glycerol-3-phosphate acyltransferase PlsY